MANHKKPLEERLFSRIEKTESCWLWLGWRNRLGYGHIGSGGRGGRNIAVHRAVYELLVGKIPDGLVIDHLCRNPPCCNPAHLEPVTQGENVRRSASARRSHCIHGHPFTPENTYRWPKVGRRRCKTCNTIAARRYRAGYQDRPAPI